MTKVLLGTVPLSRWQGLRDDLEAKIAGPQGEKWLNDLGQFLRKEPNWVKSRHDFGDDVWNVGNVRVYDRAGYGRWVNGIYKECRIIWFTNAMFFYTSTHIYDAKTFELFQWCEMSWPAWNNLTLKGFCAAVGSQHFIENVLSPNLCRGTFYNLEGKPVEERDGKFYFSLHGPGEIKIDLPEISNGCIMRTELFRAMHETFKSPGGKERLAALVN